ncbi:MAG TPA: hypothetical protein VLM40_18535, partial [Gemmata sp.]|nr:hypothetical protein [Gemmata sp.]
MQESARRLALLAALAGLFAGAGCTRKFFRDRADKDVEGVITQKNLYPNWAVKNWFVYPHPDARFADPFNPDRPLYPADDPAARLLSPNPQHPTKRTGVGRVDGVGYLRLLQQWDAENRVAEGKPAPGAAMGQNNLPPPEMDVNVRPASLESDRVVLLTPDARHPSDAAQWVAAKPQSVLAPAVGPRVGPRIIESHGALLLASGHGTEDGKVVPAMASTAANDPPTVLPEISTTADPLLPDPGTSQEPKKLPNVPKVGDDKGVPKKDQMPSGDPLITMGGTESDYLRALQSNQLGYLIRLEQAVGLGLIKSREFQDRREDLYLAALQVTLSRFNFATQAFFTEQAIRNFVGSNLSGAGRFWSLNTNAGLSKNFATGASLLVKAANQIVIDLGSMKPDIAVSNLSMSFIQPFLRGGGLAVNLEDLTFNERNMLYAMRSYARFRKIFYATVAAGSNGGNLNITNNPYGLQGLSVNLGRGIGGNLTSPVIGFLPLLLQSAVIANNRKNVAFLETLLKQYQAYVEGGQLSDLQAGQVEVQLLGSRGNLLGNVGGGGGGLGGLGGGIRGYLDSLDNFKLQLGLPMTVGLDLDEFALSPIRKILSKFEDIYTDIHKLEALAGRFDPKLTLAQQRERWRQLFTQSDLVKGTAFAKAILDRWDSWAKLSNDEITARIAKLSSERNAILDRRAERQLKSVPEPETEIRRLEQINSDLELGAFERAVRVYEG